MRCKISNLVPPLLISIVVFSLLLVEHGVDSRESSSTKKSKRKSPGFKLAPWQKEYLEKIQLAAKVGGLPEEDWKGMLERDEEACYTKACLQSALEIMQATNFTVDPCAPDMWFSYVCERRVNGVDNINQPERLMGKVASDTKMILEKDWPSEHFLLKEAQVYYHQCKNYQQNDDKDAKDILAYLSENYGEWPMLDNRAPGSKFNWMDMVADLNRIEREGFSPFLLKVDVLQGSPNIILNVGKTSTVLTQGDFEKMMMKIQKASGRKRPARLDQLQGLNTFLNVANSGALMQAYFETMSIDELQKKTDEYFKKVGRDDVVVNWLEFFQRVLKGSDIQVTGSSPNVTLPFPKIMSVIASASWADYHEGVANALNFQLATLLLQESTNLLNDLNSFKCTEQTGSKEQICYDRTTEIFGYSLGKTYLNIFYNDKVETPAIEKMMSNIQQGYVDVIDETEWMEDSTKEYLKDKINSMKTYVAEPEWTKKPKELEKFYRGLQATASKDKKSSYPLNYLAVTSWQVAKKRAHAYKVARLLIKDFQFYDSEWSRYLGNVQAQYNKAINQARIEGGIVQSPMFGADRPGFMNYGGLGMVLGHEIGHSFDVQGRTYNKYGENTEEYWDEKSLKMYEKFVLSILKEYGSETHQTSETSAETVDSRKTVNEDISDILGVYISYHSYREYLKELEAQEKKEIVLPGLKKFAPEKLFYMKYSNMWCDKKDVQDQYNDLLQSHSPGNVRATLPLKRSKEFAETFGCPPPKPIEVKK